MNDSQSYHVDWFITDDVQKNVSVTVCGELLESIQSGSATDAIDLRGFALIDGLVNAHTHLEFSEFDHRLPTSGRFTDWIKGIVGYRRTHPAIASNAIQSGISESLRSGTTLIGDIATTGWKWDDYSSSEMEGVVFQEVLGLSPERVGQQAGLAANHLQAGSKHWQPGISPHAPYSTHLELVEATVRESIQSGRPLAMHVAETISELQLLKSYSGEFRELLTDFGLWNDDHSRFGRRPRDYLEQIAKTARSLVIHGNYLDDDDLKFMSRHPSMTLVFCPRTHAVFGHSSHPWQRALELGVPVALGTDSRASNPDLSLFAELQFLAKRHLNFDRIQLLQMGSAVGRRAMGFEEMGSEGQRHASLTLIRFSNPGSTDPLQQLFAEGTRVVGTMIAGRWRWLSHEVPIELSV